MEGKFVGIGVGPGDPELITVKALKTLKTADVISVPKATAGKPSLALSMVKPILAQREKPAEIVELVFPMKKNEVHVKKLWRLNATVVAEKALKGKVVAFLTLGDPMFYSTFVYLYRSLKEAYPSLKLEIIPGVTSLTACAASAKTPVAEDDEVVAIVPSDLDFGLIEETARHVDNLVFVKCAHRLKQLVPVLEYAGFAEDATVALVRRCGMPEEEVRVGSLGELENWVIPEDYFSMAIIKRTPFTLEKEDGEA